MAIIDSLLSNGESRMKKAIDALRKELASVRAGRASAALVENILVDQYGVPLPLKQVGSISTPDPRTISIEPWDKGIISAIEKSILKSDLGLNPTNDGRVIRLVIPPLTEERRKEFVRTVHKKAEESRVAIRNIRRDIIEQVREMEKSKELSQDESHRAQDRVQKLTDSYITQADTLTKEKETEVMAV